jgi:hypothetical protein
MTTGAGVSSTRSQMGRQGKCEVSKCGKSLHDYHEEKASESEDVKESV